MLRSARTIPPGPTVSPTDWRMPNRSGISRSWRIGAKPPVEIETTTKSAPASAARWSVVPVARRPMPRTSAMCSTSSTMRGIGAGSMSSITISASCSVGVFARSTSSFGTHW